MNGLSRFALASVISFPLVCAAKNPHNQVIISPTSASLYYGGQKQFTATVSGTVNTAVTWRVSQGKGFVSPTGLFTAPSVTETAVVTVTSQADPTKSASASISVIAPPQHKVGLSWSESAYGCSFNVYRSTISGGYYSKIASRLGNSNYSDTSVSSGQTYYYVVTAVLNSVESRYSKQVTAAIP
jgi:hypothetical protein